MLLVEFRFTMGIRDRKVMRVRKGEPQLQVQIKKGEGTEYSLSLKNTTGEYFFLNLGERLIANQLACISPEALLIAPGDDAEMKVSAAPLFCQGFPATDSIVTSVMESIDTRVRQLVTGNKHGEVSEASGEEQRKEAATPGEYAAASDANGIAAFSTEGLMFAEVFADCALYGTYFDDLLKALGRHAGEYRLKPVQRPRSYYQRALQDAFSLLDDHPVLFPDIPHRVYADEGGFKGEAYLDHEGLIHLVLCNTSVPMARYLGGGGLTSRFQSKGEQLRIAYDRDVLTLRVQTQGSPYYPVHGSFWNSLFGTFGLSYETMSSWLSKESCSSIANDMLIALSDCELKIGVEGGAASSLVPAENLTAGTRNLKKRPGHRRKSSSEKV